MITRSWTPSTNKFDNVLDEVRGVLNMEPIDRSNPKRVSYPMLVIAALVFVSSCSLTYQPKMNSYEIFQQE
jgi:hypothetical protein